MRADMMMPATFRSRSAHEMLALEDAIRKVEFEAAGGHFNAMAAVIYPDQHCIFRTQAIRA